MDSDKSVEWLIRSRTRSQFSWRASDNVGIAFFLTMHCLAVKKICKLNLKQMFTAKAVESGTQAVGIRNIYSMKFLEL